MKALNFLGRDENIANIVMDTGGIPLIISLLLCCDESHETLFSESLALMKQLAGR